MEPVTKQHWLTETDPTPPLSFLRNISLWFKEHGIRQWAYETEQWAERVLQYAARAAASQEEGPAWAAERARQAALVRCIFGNVFQPVRIDAAWLTGTVVQVANAIYQEGRWQDMGVLADSLEEDGCTDEEVLSHCRGGPHARGCYVVDALLGKT